MKTYPLLQSQLGVLLQSMQHPDSTQYNLPNYTFMPLSMTRERVVSAVQKLVESFPELHTRFVVGEQGEVRQCCDMSMPIPVATRKCTEAELQTYINEGFVRPFDLFGSEPLFRAEVIETEKNICMLFDGHHSIVDGMSFVPIISKALAQILEGGSIEVPSYGMYQAAEDEAEAFGTEAYQRAKEYYAQKFAGLEMATLSHSPYGTMGAMGRKTTTVSRKVCDDWCREHGVQVNLLFQAAFSHVVSVLTRQQQVAYATVNHGRMDKRLRNSVGMFVKTVPIKVNADPSQRVVDFIKCLRSELMSTIRYGIYPFTHFCSDLVMKPGIMFDFLAVDDMEEHMMLSESEIRAGQPVRKEIDSDISVDIYLKGDSYEIRVQSSLAMNDEATLQMVAEAVRVAVCNMIAHPDATLGELDNVSDEECDALLQLGTGKHLDIDPTMTFVKAFEACARKNPDRLAVADEHESLTYSKLSRCSDILAHRLIESGVEPGDFVAVMLDRTIAFPLAVIAIHKAGAAYVPIDLEYPEERQKYMLEDCGAKVVIDSQFIAETDFVVSGKTADNIDLSKPNGLAYMIYTSGSTGRPKGVMIGQSALWNFVNTAIHAIGLTADDRVGSHFSFSFDGHVEDIFPILTLGGSVQIMPTEIRQNLESIKQFLIDNNITYAGFTTPVAIMMLNTYGNDLPIRAINSGGEKMPPVYSDCIDIINSYGPTECTCVSSYYTLPRGVHVDNVPIGRPALNSYYFLTDKMGRLVPRGAVGELCFASQQVARGYWQQPEQTAEKFVDCPFIHHPSSISPLKMYRTGDLCRWNADGQMEYVGRFDSQVKLHGYRIELGEVETCAAHFEGIKQAVAVVRPVAGSDALCLYYTTVPGVTAIDTDELSRFMSRLLADYMVPAAYMQLDTLPLMPNGKVDRRQLPEPKLKQETVVAPISELERLILSIVAEQMGTDAISVTSDLVSLGMSSLDAMRLSLTIGQQTGLMVPVGELLEHPTIRHMAEVAHRPKADRYIDLADFHREQDSYPLTENQLGIYIDWEMNRNTTQYNVPVAICLGKQDATQLVEALQQVINAHSYIKTRLAQQEEGVVQLRRNDAPVKVTVTALDSEPDRDFIQQRVRPFNLFTDDLYRLEIYTYGGRTWLFKDFHHIVSDGLSDAIFFRDMLAACQGTKPHAETVTSFDYALYEQQLSTTDRYAEARDYFDSLLAGTEVATYPHSSNSTKHESQYLIVKISNSESIRKACRRMGITPNSYFQTVVTQVLHRMTHQQRLMLATVSNGRSLAQMQNMMGMFVKTLPVVSEIAAEGITFATAAQTMHRQSIESMNRDFYPLTQMVERHGLRPEILYSFEGGIFDNVAAAFSPDTDIIVPTLDTQKMPIVVTIYPDREGIFNIALSYDTALYSQASMETLAEALVVYADHATCEGILVCDIEMTTDEQRETLKKLGCGEHLDFDHNDTLVSLFRRQAAATPDAIAVVFGDRRMTYSELDSLTDRLACRLINKYNVQPEEAVGVMIDRSELMVVYPLAIMKAGGCYLPLDYSFPTDRLQYMCQDAGVRLVLSEAQRVSEAMPDFNGNVLTNDVFATLPSCDIELPVVDAEQRYVLLYTSGSTGMPKGVALEHHNMVNYCHWYAKECRLSSVDHVMAYANFGFDAHMLDIFPTLSAGASVYILSSEIRMDLMAMNQYMEANAINVTFITTQIGYLFATTMDNKSLRLLTTGGEKLLPLKKPRFDMYNLYGPTEATIGPTYFKIDKDFDSSIIGGPIANVQLYVVDSDMCLVPKGVPGELIIGGAGVGRGYLHPAEKDAHIFFIYEGQRCYRTGDLVRWTDDGNLEFLGRIDNQVKLRGLRIEMGEIEACASRFEGIGQVAAQITNGQYICLYYTADAAVDVNALKQHLANRLAAYMIPTAYMQLDAMPLNANGKIDRSRLPEPSTTAKLENVSPRTEKDVVLLVIAQHVLGRDDFGITDDLFDLGLTSITAIKVAAMADASGVHISVNNLMRFRTIQQVFDAETPVGYWFNNYSPEKPVLIVPHGAVPVISMTEKFREWQNHFSIYTFEPADEHASRLSPDLDYDKLIMAYADLLDRDIPADAHVFGFLGYSWGGELCYSLAAQWQQRHGGKPQVYICDTFVYEPDDPKMTEEQILQVLVQYLMSHAADFDMSSLQTPEDGENGAVFNMTQMKFGKDASFAGEVLKIVTKKFYYSELYRRIQPLPIYDGHVTFFVATHENPRMTENLSRWKKVAPTMEIIEINDNHFNFSLRNKNTYLVTERLLDDLRHELRNKKSEE